MAFVAVGEEQHDASSALPLGFTTGDKLIDDDLGAVGEITELSLPDAKHIGVIECVAVVETEHRCFGEERIIYTE